MPPPPPPPPKLRLRDPDLTFGVAGLWLFPFGSEIYDSVFTADV